MSEQPDWIGSTTASKVVGVNPQTLISWADKGLMPNVKTRVLPSGRTQFDRADLQKYANVLNGKGSDHDYS